LVERLIEVLELDQDPAAQLRAWEAAGLWPPNLSAAEVDDLSERLTTRRLAAQAGSHRGGQDAATGLPTNLQGEEKRASLQRAGVAA